MEPNSIFVPDANSLSIFITSIVKTLFLINPMVRVDLGFLSYPIVFCYRLTLPVNILTFPHSALYLLYFHVCICSLHFCLFFFPQNPHLTHFLFVCISFLSSLTPASRGRWPLVLSLVLLGASSCVKGRCSSPSPSGR